MQIIIIKKTTTTIIPKVCNKMSLLKTKPAYVIPSFVNQIGLPDTRFFQV